MYPNPSKDEVYIESERNLSDAKITIINSLGTIVSEQITQENLTKLNTSNLKSGIYFIQLLINGKTLVKKLIIE